MVVYMKLRIIQKVATLSLFIAFCVGLTACGLKGDLYLPERQVASSINELSEQAVYPQYG